MPPRRKRAPAPEEEDSESEEVVVGASEEDEEDDNEVVSDDDEQEMRDEEVTVATTATTGPEEEEEEEEEDIPTTLPPASQESQVPKDHVPRLMIKRIRLHNFKSYAGVKEIGPFHHRFSAIVGPNGSGKSNLIDALLFVFGYRTKKLRLNKLSELIHNSNHGSDLPSASVEIQFQQVIDTNLEREEYDIIPDSEIVLKRQATADNKSHYFLNGEKSTFSEVRNLLMKHNIDLNNNRFLILQGEVELISQMKPKAPTPHEDGLLEYIEDIIGSNRLIEEIDKAVQELETLNTERAQQLNRVKAIQYARDGLEGAKQEAESFLETEGEILDLQAVLGQLQMLAHQVKIDKIDKQRAPIEEKLQALRDSMKDQLESLQTLEKEHEQKRKDHAKIAKELEQTKEDFHKFERKREKLKQERVNYKKQSTSLGKQIEKDEKELTTLQRALETAQSELQQSEDNVATYTAQQEQKEKELEAIQNSIQSDTASLREGVEKQKNKLMPKQKVVDDLQRQIQEARNELALLEEKENSGQKYLEEAQQSLQTASQRVSEAGQEIGQVQQEAQQAEKRLPAVQKELQQVEQTIARDSAAVREMRAKYEHSQSQAQENTSRSKVLNACLHLKDQRGLAVYGRLGNLGAIDSAYDVAISTACRELDSIVVKTFHDAQQCIEHMKQHNLGRARFIILDDQTHLKQHMYQLRGQTPENAPRLFDLIRTKDEALLPVFYFALRDTLVAKDLEQAKRLAYGKQRFRVVTLVGGIIDKAGTVTGGGQSVSKGGMRSELAETGLSKEEMASLARQIDEGQRKLQELQQRREALQAECERLRHVVENASHRLETLKMDEDANKKHERELQARIKEMKKQLGSSTSNAQDIARIESLREEIEKLQAPLEKAQQATAPIEAEIQSLQQQIMEKGGLPLKIKQTEVDDIISLIDDTKKAVTRHRVKVKSTTKKIESLQTTIENSRAELEKALTAHDQKKEEHDALVEQGKQVLEKYNDAQSVLDQTDTELEECSRRYEETKQDVSGFRSKELDLTNQLDTFTQNLDQFRKAYELDQRQQETLAQRKAALYEAHPDLATPLRTLEAEEVETCDAKSIKTQLSRLEERLKHMNPNMGAISEWRAKDKECEERNSELEVVTGTRDNQQRHCEALRKKRLDEFMSGFAVINRKLKEMYRMITLEGDAELEFVDSIDPFSEGILFSVRPPKKSWKYIANLSGGEKTLSSLALVFALHHYKPTPLYFMDEIDAALDFKNVSIVAHYIKERTKNAQFIIISLRNNMFELADHLIGIYKPDNCTQSVTINPNEHKIG